jgi:hypothetical protein
LNLEPRNLKIQARHFLGLLGCVPAASMYTLESPASVDLRPRGETGGQEGVEMAASSTRQYSCGSQWEESTWILGCCGIVTSRRMKFHKLALYLTHIKVDGSFVARFLNRTLKYDWFVVR